MVGLVETPGIPASRLGFSVSHQKVELDIDFATRSLKGKTEITISPHFKELKVIRLNCRQCNLTRLNVNNRAPNIKYQEPYARSSRTSYASVHQHHLLRQKLEPLLKDPPDEELIITLPKSIKIDELDPLSADAALAKINGAIKRDSIDTSALSVTTPIIKAGEDQTARFTPITVNIEFSIEKIRDGLHFVGLTEGDLRYPHVYSRNSQFSGGSCCLFPCIDDPSSRHTWELSIKCPRTLGDVFRPRTASSHVNGNNETLTNGTNGVHPHETHGNSGRSPMDIDDDDDMSLDIAVVASGDMTDEVVDANDPRKKTVSFLCSNAVAAQHIGFAIGPFEHADLSEFREADEDDKLGSNAIRVHGFCLPGRADEVRNTCLPLAKAIDSFTVTYGSYPFSSYKLCFVDDQVADTVHTASFTLCSNRLLFPEDILEPLDRVTRILVHALVSQWIGVNIIPKESTDTWVIIGISYFITDIFLKKLCGNNEYRYRQKKSADRLCEVDVQRPSIYAMGALLALDPSEAEFMALKAPLVLFVLDRRLAKASGSSGLSRIISRIFLNAKVGDLPNSAITTAYFLRTCEKLGHARLDTFFQQWIYGAGCPRFSVTQRFNKKKLVVEMLIKQTQAEQSTDRNLEPDTFLRDVKEEIHNVYAGPIQPVFTGPMTIRIHEADGTPYEHIVEIKEASTKFEIPYNTKYKRLKRSRRQKERAAAASGVDAAADAQDDVLLYCLGDVLQSEEEVADWRLVDWSKEDEERMNQESYEWIRMDADFEWICTMAINMPAYMFLSQLQQDRDIVAQLESIQYIATQREHPLVSTILVRTLMDRRYFHGIRTSAAHALAKNAKDELDWIGLFHLEKAFQEFFCFPNSPMTRSNDFSNRTSYYIQCAIPQAISNVRDHSGRAPLRAKKFLLDKLKFNDNSNNEFSDCHYVAILMSALTNTLLACPEDTGYSFAFEDDEDEDERLQKAAIDEIERYRSMDEWISSYQNIYSVTALDCKRQLALAKVIEIQISDFLQYTQEDTFDPLRLKAFSCVVDLGLFKNDAVLHYFLYILGSDRSPYVRESMHLLFGRALGLLAIGDPVPEDAPQQLDGLIIEQEASSTEARKSELARTQTVPGAVAALKSELESNDVLKKALWESVLSADIGLDEIFNLLDICSTLYDPRTSLVVTLKYPRYWKVENKGNGKLLFSRSNKSRTKPKPKLEIGKLQRVPSPLLKRADSHRANPTPKIVFKPKKPPLAPPAPRADGPPPSASPPADGKPKLTLKFKMGGGSAKSPT
ncbi:MAG: hypothetical protein M1819_001896 [Sarea resinae]|nr:MAG: hypothetical protein M1819_001896 [Sarea resinae]